MSAARWRGAPEASRRARAPRGGRTAPAAAPAGVPGRSGHVAGPSRRGGTPLQHEPSAHAPWMRTIFGRAFISGSLGRLFRMTDQIRRPYAEQATPAGTHPLAGRKTTGRSEIRFFCPKGRWWDIPGNWRARRTRPPAARLTAQDPAGPGARAAAWFRLRVGAGGRGYVRRARMSWPLPPFSLPPWSAALQEGIRHLTANRQCAVRLRIPRLR